MDINVVKLVGFSRINCTIFIVLECRHYLSFHFIFTRIWKLYAIRPPRSVVWTVIRYQIIGLVWLRIRAEIFGEYLLQLNYWWILLRIKLRMHSLFFWRLPNTSLYLLTSMFAFFPYFWRRWKKYVFWRKLKGWILKQIAYCIYDF